MSGIQMLLAAGGAKAVVLLNGSPITTNTYVYNNSNTVNTLTVTAPLPVTFSVWGAAGGNGSYNTASTGSGAGGFAKGTATLQPGTTYYLYVGEGGKGPTSSAGQGGLGGWPNGGYGTSGDASGAGGGGMSMVSTATFSTGMSTSSILLIAGAGGGSTGYAGQAGAGGGTSGENGGSTITGGTQSAGGTYNGAYLTGGNAIGSRTSQGDDGGGGGGGYYGGGGGTSDARPGGGGSGYINGSLVSASSLLAGAARTPPNPDGTLLSTSYAYGKSDIGGTPQNGFNGLIYLVF